MLKKIANTKGQSILEIIVAMAIFALVSAAIATMAVGSFGALIQGGEYSKAEALAQEALEAVKSIKDRAWNESRFNQSALDGTGDYWVFAGEGTQEKIDIYTRVVTLHDVCRDAENEITDCPGEYLDVHAKEARVLVSWETGMGKIATIEKRTYITNWDTELWTQNDWAGGSGQSTWLNSDQYDSDDDQVYINTSGKVTLGQTSMTQGYYNWDFDEATDYVYDSEKIEVSEGKVFLLALGEGSYGELKNPGFEYATETSYDWNFSEPNDYVYDDEKIEVFGGLAQLKATDGSSASGETDNAGFDSGSSGWTYYDWSQDAGDPDATGTWYATGGNPDGYVDVNLPFNLRNRTLGGYWEQSITTTVDNPEAYCEIDWKAFAVTLPPPGVNSLYVAIYLDNASGEPSGTPILQKNFTAVFDWESHSGNNRIDCSDAMTSAGTYYYKVAVWITAKNQNTGPIRIGFDNAKVSWNKSEGGSYPTDEPAIYPDASYSAPGVLNWDSFTEIATKNGGEINYQLSDDNGTAWQYWDGATWTEAGALNHNSASVVNTNISSFSTSTEQIKFRAFLKSDGSQLVQLDNVNIGLTPSPPEWSFGTWDVGGGEIAPSGSIQPYGGIPDKYADIKISSDKNYTVGGYWEQAFTLDKDNSQIDFSFDYKVFDFNGSPDVAEIRAYIDSASGDPINQVITPIPVSAETDWASSTEFDLSSILPSAGTYYLKLALWVGKSGADTAGPFTIGFDNASLNWRSQAYPSDKPKIKPSASFEPTVISEWLSFIETATSTGEAVIYYQLSDDDGSTWKYWDGSTWSAVPGGEEDSENYNTAETVNSYINQFDVNNQKLLFRAFLVSDGSQYLELDNIKVEYKITASQYYGNQFYADSFSSAGALNQNKNWTSLRFTAQETKTVEAIRVYLEEEVGLSPTYRYGLQSDNNGVPSGTWLGASNTAYGDYQATTIGWQRVILNQSATLTAGQTYHLVVQHQAGAVNVNRYVSLRKSDPNNLKRPFDNSSDPNSNVLYSTDSGGNWTVLGSQPIYVLDFSDINYGGNPYHELSEHTIYGDNFYGVEFTAQDDGLNISMAEFLVSKNRESPAGDLFLTAYHVDSEEVLGTAELYDPAQITLGSYSWTRFDFTESISFSAGNTYRLYLSSPDSASEASYLIRSIYNENASVYNSINYAGTNAFTVSSADGGTSWNTDAINYDIAGYRFGQTIFHGSGFLISSAYNTGTTSAFTVIEWDGDVPACSPVCEIKMQIQTAPDNGGAPGAWTTTWCGPEGNNGNEDDYFTTKNGELIHPDNNQAQWIRYKAILLGDTTKAPLLEEVRIYYQ